MAKRWLPVMLLLWLAVAGKARGQEGDVPEEGPAQPGRLQVGLEYLFMWSKADVFRPLATSGDPSDDVPAALGQPGTRIINNGNLDHGLTNAGRLSVAYFLGEPRRFALESNFFIAEQRTNIFSFASNGAPGSRALGRPFFNPVANREDADPRALPDVLEGSINFNFRTRLMGAEGNVRWLLTGEPLVSGPSVSLLGGIRFLRLDEAFTSPETVTELPEGAGKTYFISDSFSTYNQFWGPQLGVQVKYRWDTSLTLDVQGKFALGPNLQSSGIDGFTSITDAGGKLLASGRQGLFAQPTNVGAHNHTAFSFVPEVAVNFGWEVTPWCRLKLGYTFMHMSNVARPGDQIDRVVSIQPLFAPAQVGPARPLAPAIRETDFWVQFVNMAMEVTF